MVMMPILVGADMKNQRGANGFENEADGISYVASRDGENLFAENKSKIYFLLSKCQTGNYFGPIALEHSRLGISRNFPSLS